MPVRAAPTSPTDRRRSTQFAVRCCSAKKIEVVPASASSRSPYVGRPPSRHAYSVSTSPWTNTTRCAPAVGNPSAKARYSGGTGRPSTRIDIGWASTRAVLSMSSPIRPFRTAMVCAPWLVCDGDGRESSSATSSPSVREPSAREPSVKEPTILAAPVQAAAMLAYVPAAIASCISCVGRAAGPMPCLMAANVRRATAEWTARTPPAADANSRSVSSPSSPHSCVRRDFFPGPGFVPTTFSVRTSTETAGPAE